MYTLHRDKNKRRRELHQSGTFERDSILRYVHNEFQSGAMIRIVSVYCLSRHPDVNYRLNVSSNFYM